MTLEITFRRFSLLPGLVQTGNGEPRKAHFLGKKEATPVEKQDQGRRNDSPPQKQRTVKYRELADITLGEVDDAIGHFMPQLVASPAEGWIARNYFCQLPLRRRSDEQSPVIFGRVKTTYPGDGNVQNIDEMEMHFPQWGAAPDLLHIRREDIHWQKPIHSYCVGVKMFLSEAEMADFSRSENIFIEKGYAPLYESGYLELLEMNEQNQGSTPWLSVIGSEWFASIPETVQPEIRERLRDLADWDRVLLNYHPKRHQLRYLTLNDELDFHYGFTKHFLVSPQDSGQTLRKVDELFGKIFRHGMA